MSGEEGKKDHFEETAMNLSLTCFGFVACHCTLNAIFGEICTFSPFLLSVMSHHKQNPCITKQLDQKPPVMQQGSVAPYLLPR